MKPMTPERLSESDLTLVYLQCVFLQKVFDIEGLFVRLKRFMVNIKTSFDIKHILLILKTCRANCVN